ncbi:MAG: chitobiase/beta-hexosaminidase C-terminal domain-containing protein, partial [Sedimentisphaerales bacterium]
YHTNFELNHTGEYLALVAPDGNTVIHEYDEYPRQLTDISYGLTQFATTLVPAGATASYHVPTIGDAGTDWTNVSFDDSSWDTGETGLGFGIGGKQTVAYNDCLWERDTEDYVTDWTIYSGYTGHSTGKLKDSATGSDVGMPTVTFTMGAEGLGKSSGGSGGIPEPGTDARDIFYDGGDNVIVDFGPDLVYYGNPGWWAEIELTGLDPASMYSFAGTAIRSSDYTDPPRKSLFTIMGHNGAVNNSSDGVVSKTDTTTVLFAGDNSITGYVVRWDDIIPAGDGSFKVRAEATADSENGRAYPFGGFMLEGGGGDSELQDDMLGVNASLWSRIKFNVTDPGNFDTLQLRMKYEDGFVAYINGEEVARRNAPGSVEWNSTALSDRPNEDSLVFEEFNLMAYLHLLQPGINVLAIHGLNDDKDNGDFLILPELVAARNRPVPQYFTTPTPWTFNKPGAIGLVEEVWLSHKRGFHDDSFLLTLSTATEGAEIRYTTDSSTPTITHGNIYTSPILIDKITTLRAVAVKPGWLDSDVETHSYYFLDDVITQATDPVTGAQVVPDGYPDMWISGSDIVTGNYQVDPDVVGQGGTDIFGGLYANTIKNDMISAPTISMVMDKDDWFGGTGIYINQSQDGTERVASFEFVNPKTGEDFQVNCAIAMQGGVSGGGTSLDRWKVYKLSMRPRFKDSLDNGLPTGGPRKLDYKFFADSPIEHFDTIVLDAVLNNAWNHSSQHATAIYIQDQCISDFHNAMGGHSPHGFYAHVYINELYWGMYYLHERPDHSWAAEMFGGEKEEYDAIKHSLIYEAINDGGGYGSGTAKANFNAMLSAADAVQADPTNPTKYNTLCEMLDVDNFITYVMSHWYGVNWDWPQKNWYATHRHPNGKWRFHTWDAEHSLEWYNTQTVRGLSPYSVHDRLKGNAEYKMRFADIVHRAMFNDGPLTSSRSAQIVQARMNQVDRPIVGESARWGDTRVTIPHTREDLFNNLNNVLTGFISPRWSFLYNWLKSGGLYPNVVAPIFKINGAYQHGGEVSSGDQLTMDTPPSGTIYCTIDGIDPREPWTENAVGTPYTPITLSKSTHVKARVRDGSTWSALNEATYSVGPLVKNLRITEIMYHPRNAGALTDPNEEFIELKNIGTSTLNLNMVQFTEGIHFTFPDIELDPDECVVVVEDQSAFEAKYGTGVNTAGQYIGSLANNGERIKLQDAIGQTILDFEYKDGWHSIADGDGFSLTMIDPTDKAPYSWDEGLVAHWKFDDGSGSTAIDSAGTNNGTLYGDKTWTTGRIDGALSFDG